MLVIYKNRVPAYLTVYRGRLYTLTHTNIYIYIYYITIICRRRDTNPTSIGPKKGFSARLDVIYKISCVHNHGRRRFYVLFCIRDVKRARVQRCTDIDDDDELSHDFKIRG